MRMSHLASIAFACSISLFSTATFAQPAADDGLCDELHVSYDVTPGLYGLCVAYWATEDNGNSDASSKILAKYNQRKEPDEPEMPGTLEDCPCWTTEELGIWQSKALGDIYCYYDTDTLFWFSQYDTLQTNEQQLSCNANISSGTAEDGNALTREYPVGEEEPKYPVYEGCFARLSNLCESLTVSEDI